MSISKRLIGTPQEEGVGRRRIRRPASPSWRMAMLSPSRSGSAFQVLYKNASAHWDDWRGTTGNRNTSSCHRYIIAQPIQVVYSPGLILKLLRTLGGLVITEDLYWK